MSVLVAQFPGRKYKKLCVAGAPCCVLTLLSLAEKVLLAQYVMAVREALWEVGICPGIQG